MFGDPVTNNFNWKIQLLSNITTKIGSGITPKGGRESYLEIGTTLIRSMNVHNGFFSYRDLAFVSSEQAEKMRGVSVEKDDILLNITGASVARSCVVPVDVLPARVNQHVCIIRPSREILSVFLNYLFTDKNFQLFLWRLAGSGATREAITKQQLENLDIPLPPLPLQEEFARFVEAVDKSKLAVKQSLDELETLKKKLMQDYFG